MKHGIFLNPTRDTYIMKLIKKDDGNTPFNYGQNDIVVDNTLIGETHNPEIIFRGSPAGNKDKKSFRLTKGVAGSDNSIMVKCSNLPDNIDIDDRVFFMGEWYSVKGIGYYYEQSKFVNGGIFDEKYIQDRCEKGLNLG